MVRKVKNISGGVVQTGKWEKDFSKARNLSFDLVPKDYDWILWLDSDDTLVNPDKLRSMLEKAPKMADGIMVRYDYDTDSFGNVTTSHTNLRIVRNNGAFKWRARLHETLIETRRVNRVATNEVSVLHHADEDRKNDSNQRNIAIMEEMFEEEKEFPDPRTMYYLGTAYIDAGRSAEAIQLLETYLKLSGWDEERAQAHVWLGRLYRDAKEDTTKAVDHFLHAISENPKEASAYVEMGSIEMANQRWPKAIHWLEMAVVKKEKGSTLVSNPMEKTYRAYMMLAECHLNLGGDNINTALKFCELAKNLRPDEFTTNYYELLKRLINEKNMVNSFVNAAKRADEKHLKTMYEKLPDDYKENPAVIAIMRRITEPKKWPKNSIAIYCGNSVLKGWGPWSLAEGTGGSEEAVIRISKRLQALGWEVTVYADPGAKDGVYDGVAWRNYWEIDLRDTYDIFVAWRAPWFFETPVNARKSYLWLHDVMDDEEFTPERLKNIDKIMLLSKYHKSVYPSIPEEKVFYTANGIDPEDFQQWDNKLPRDNQRVVYMSSHVRGLDNLYTIWPDVIKEVPNAKLDVYYGWNSYDEVNRNNPERMAWKEKMIQLEQTLPNVKDHGRIGQEEIVKAIQGAGIWAYPTQFCEIYCITAVKAQAGGAWPVCTDFAALDEMVTYGYKQHMESSKELATLGRMTDEELETYKQALIDALKNPISEAKRLEMMMETRKKHSWEVTAEGWDKEFKS
jgi:glycosyltransferase involved in cell wall biosynthesis